MSRIFRKSFNRIGCMNSILLVTFLLVWSISYVKPIYDIDYEKARLFYGTLDYVRIHPGFNKLAIRINQDSELKLTLWLSDDDLDVFKANYTAHEAVGIWAFASGGSDYLAFLIESEAWALNPDSIIDNYDRIKLNGIVIISILSLILLFLAKEYLVWFRHRKWLYNVAKEDDI